MTFTKTELLILAIPNLSEYSIKRRLKMSDKEFVEYIANHGIYTKKQGSKYIVLEGSKEIVIN